MLALLFNLDLSELAIILIGAILVFGRNLPQVAMRGAAQFVKLRRQLMQVWREAGFEEELRKAQRELETSVPKLPPPKSFFDAPPPKTPDAPKAAAGGLGLAAAHAEARQGPDEDPDQRQDWEAGNYGPSEEEKRAADAAAPSPDQSVGGGDKGATAQEGSEPPGSPQEPSSDGQAE